MYLDYFDKFKGMSPYLAIDETEWKYIQETFQKEDVLESMATVLMTYDLPYADISIEDTISEFQKLKGIKWKELLKEIWKTHLIF